LPSLISKQNGYRSRSRNPPSPLLNISSALVLSAFTAGTAFASIALASSAVPDWPGCCAKAAGESIRSAADAAAIVNARIIGFFSLLGLAPEQRIAVQNLGRPGARDANQDQLFSLFSCLPTASGCH